MQSARARTLREDDHDLNAEREAVLSAWERKALIGEPPLRSRRFERRAEAQAGAQADRPTNVVQLPERRTVTITGQPGPRRRPRQSAARRQLGAQPDRIALWAFLLGLFLIVVAAATANAAPL